MMLKIFCSFLKRRFVFLTPMAEKWKFCLNYPRLLGSTWQKISNTSKVPDTEKVSLIE